MTKFVNYNVESSINQERLYTSGFFIIGEMQAESEKKMSEEIKMDEKMEEKEKIAPEVEEEKEPNYFYL